ncbi:MAG: 50S ribosomal protein L11 methyltransferase [Hyphomicrobiales bacterium]|nr:50S ribosomal protein L11 methyltransferase [Hyphomicrobiales bacterium]
MPLATNEFERITELQSLAALPELTFAGLPAAMTLEAFRTAHCDLLGAGVPYWAVAWPGGQALARFLLDNPDRVVGRQVIDIGCGAGLVAAAAMRAGAAGATALDHDPNAVLAAAQTARLNDVEVAAQLATIEGLAEELEAARDTIVCAGDLWYEPETGRRATTALTGLAAQGTEVYCGDPGRPGRPRTGVKELARYTISVAPEFATGRSVRACVFALLP